MYRVGNIVRVKEVAKDDYYPSNGPRYIKIKRIAKIPYGSIASGMLAYLFDCPGRRVRIYNTFECKKKDVSELKNVYYVLEKDAEPNYHFLSIEALVSIFNSKSNSFLRSRTMI